MPRGFIATPGPIQTATFGAALPMARATRTICAAGISRFLLGPGRRAVLELEVPPLHQAVGLLLGEGGLVDRLAGDEQVLAVLEVADELPVPQALGEQHVGDGAGQRAVGARA